MSTLRQQAEQEFAQEIEELIKHDTAARPDQWKMSPQAVVNYLMGGKLKNGFDILPKYIGDRRLMEIAVATLTTDRALLLYGIPGTGKSWVSEHIAAAVSGDSTMLIQGTAGTGEEAIRYGWNYAKLLSDGPSKDAIVETPMIRGMLEGKCVRIEELTRIPADVQDTLITVLSEKMMPVPELDIYYQAVKGFNVIATANNRDKGVNELSSALKRRFNTVILPTPKTSEEEVHIVHTRVHSLAKSLELPAEVPIKSEIERIVKIFRELRHGVTEDGKTKIKSPTSTLSTAEVISVVNSGLSLAAHFGDGKVSAHDVASGLIGAVIKDPVQDEVIWEEYLENVMKQREDYRDIYRACKEQ